MSWDPVTGAAQYTATITATPPPAPAASSLTTTKHLEPNFHLEPPTSFPLDATAGWTYKVSVVTVVSNTDSEPTTSAATCNAVAPPAPTGLTALRPADPARPTVAAAHVDGRGTLGPNFPQQSVSTQ